MYTIFHIYIISNLLRKVAKMIFILPLYCLYENYLQNCKNNKCPFETKRFIYIVFFILKSYFIFLFFRFTNIMSHTYRIEATLSFNNTLTSLLIVKFCCIFLYLYARYDHVPKDFKY